MITTEFSQVLKLTWPSQKSFKKNSLHTSILKQFTLLQIYQTGLFRIREILESTIPTSASNPLIFNANTTQMEFNTKNFQLQKRKRKRKKKKKLTYNMPTLLILTNLKSSKISLGVFDLNQVYLVNSLVNHNYLNLVFSCQFHLLYACSYFCNYFNLPPHYKTSSWLRHCQIHWSSLVVEFIPQKRNNF